MRIEIACAGLLFFSATALAQSPEPPGEDAPPPPPEPGQAKAISPPHAAAPVFSRDRQTSTSEEPPAREPSEPEGPSAPASKGAGPLLWAGTLASLGNSFSTQYLGIGDSLVGGEDFADVFSFAVSGGVFLLRKPAHKLRASTTIGFEVELTNSNTTTTKNEPVLWDIPLRLAYTGTLLSTGQGAQMRGLSVMRDPTLQGTGDHRTWVLATGSVRFPTSKESQAAHLYSTTGLVLGLRQQVKLLGSDAPGLTHALVSWTGFWTHPFYATKINAPQFSSTRPLTVIAESPDSGRIHTENIFGTTVRLTVPLFRDLELDASFSWARDFKYVPDSNTCIQLPTGCAAPSTIPSGKPNSYDFTAFDLSFSYLVLPELGVEIGYANTAYVLGANGKPRDPFYSPSAVFYGDLVFSFDRLYERLARP